MGYRLLRDSSRVIALTKTKAKQYKKYVHPSSDKGVEFVARRDWGKMGSG